MERILPMKYPHHQSYTAEQTDLCERALLTVWPKLADHHHQLALIGGLAPRYLCVKNGDPFDVRTLDVDLALSLAADEGNYEPLSWRLRSEGFKVEKSRYVKEVNGVKLYIDFLTEAAPPGGQVITIDDIPANGFPGVARALEITRDVPIEGQDLRGAQVKEIVRVCEAGPFLCLKLSSYGQRGEAKDLFDAMTVATRYDKGFEAAITAFKDEAGINPAYPLAVETLRRYGQDAKGRAPIHYADFCYGALRGQIPEADFNQYYGECLNEAVEFSRAALMPSK
jgi:hypothetical protein